MESKEIEIGFLSGTFIIWILPGDRYHRENGPAFLELNLAGQKIMESWYYYNKRHRVDGPAQQIWDNNGILIVEEYWILDKQIPSLKEWLIDNNLHKPYDTWTDEETVLWRLRWM